MRKELVIFIPTYEQGEEISISSVAKNREYIILSSPNGTRTTANLEELLKAVEALKQFNIDNNTESDVSVSNDFNDVEYGDGQ